MWHAPSTNDVTLADAGVVLVAFAGAQVPFWFMYAACMSREDSCSQVNAFADCVAQAPFTQSTPFRYLRTENLQHVSTIQGMGSEESHTQAGVDRGRIRVEVEESGRVCHASPLNSFKRNHGKIFYVVYYENTCTDPRKMALTTVSSLKLTATSFFSPIVHINTCILTHA